MATNPFFNTAYYYQNNKDVYASGMDAYAHYLEYGAVEALEGAAGRKPAPWFDIDFYYENNPDLIAAKLTAPELFQHFTTYGYKEGRAPNAAAEQNVNADSLLAYALANPDLLEAFGIEADATELTDAQFADLSFQYFAYGYKEDRPALPGSGDVPGVDGDGAQLTVGVDNILVEGNNNTVYAPIEQNFLGAVTNTLESGDVIRGVEGSTGNTLVADLALGVTGTMPVAPAISATTEYIDNVVLRAQVANDDNVGAAQGNLSHIDAEKFKGVKEWWSDNSRATIQIEDVRTAPEDTLIGLSNSDPFVGFNVYFDPQQLQAGQTQSNSQLTLTLVDNTDPTSLDNVPVDGFSFVLGGETYTVQSEEIGAAENYEEFVAAIEAAMGEVEGLENVGVKLNANNTITLTNSSSEAFGAGGWKFINDEVPSAGTITWDQTVGAPDVADELISTTVVLDNVGRTSQGGTVDVGSLGDGGVQEFDVQVGVSSWVSSLQSKSYLGDNFVWDEVLGIWNNINGLTEDFLEVVNVAHRDGANGNLTIGTQFDDNGQRIESTDGRVVDGLTDVRELNAANFSGDIKAGITLTDNVISRYLDDAEGVVDFNYNTGSGEDNLTVDVANALTQDADFALNVDLGAGDDRLNLDLNGGLANKVSVDGGEGTNTIELRADQGTNPGTTFNSFANFQNYIVAGNVGTDHVFGDSSGVNGVENVTVATGSSVGAGLTFMPILGDTTTLTNLEADTTVSISGKNQTLGNSSNNNQAFGAIDIVNATDAELTVSLDNTARIDGNMNVGALNIDMINAAGEAIDRVDTTTRTLNLESNGVRQTSNAVNVIDAQYVNTFNLSGTQDLTTAINSAANAAATASARANFTVDASELTAAVDLTVNTNIVNNVVAAGADKNVTLTGAEGAGDVLTFEGVSIATKELTTVSGFETVNFALSGAVDSTYNAVKTTGVEQYNIQATSQALELTNLSNDVNVDIATDAVNSNVTLRGEGANINVDLSSAAGTAGLNSTWTAPAAVTDKFIVGGYKTVNLDLNNTSVTSLNPLGIQQEYDFNLFMADSNGNIRVQADGTTANTDYMNNATVAARDLVLTGGREVAKNDGTNSDTVTLNNLDNALRTIDISDYAGHVTGSMDTASSAALPTSNVKVVVGAWNMAWDVLNGENVISNITYNTTFKFTEASSAGAEQSVWTIDTFIARETATATVANHSVLDLSDLGITAYTDLQVVAGNDVNGNLATIITSKEESLASNETWEIQLTGVTEAELGVDVNFIFA